MWWGPSCGSTNTPPGFYSSAIYLKRTFSACSFSHCISSWGQFVKFVSFLAFYICGQWLSSGPCCSGKWLRTFILSHGMCIVCGSPSRVALTVWDSDQWWSCAGRNDLCEAHGACSHESCSGDAWRFKSIPRPTTQDLSTHWLIRSCLAAISLLMDTVGLSSKRRVYPIGNSCLWTWPVPHLMVHKLPLTFDSYHTVWMRCHLCFSVLILVPGERCKYSKIK